MQLRFTKGVGVALAIAAGCAVLGFVMAPGWWALAAFSAWWAISLMSTDGDQSSGVPHEISIENSSNNQTIVMRDFLDGTDPIMRSHASNVYTDWESLR